MTHSEIISAIEAHAPLSLQEAWDNSGWQTGEPAAQTTGVILCLDVTPQVIEEAKEKQCNLIIAHHPLIFKGVKQITGRNRVERCITEAIRSGISVYSSHTAMDCAPQGVSIEMANLLGLTAIEVLDPATGLGAVGNLPLPMSATEFLTRVKRTFDAPVLKTSRSPQLSAPIRRVALCGGSAGEFLPNAIAAGADVYITADCKLNQFIDNADDILLVDAGHFETEHCTKEIFYRIISEKFPNFAVYKSAKEENPIIYL